MKQLFEDDTLGEVTTFKRFKDDKISGDEDSRRGRNRENSAAAGNAILENRR